MATKRIMLLGASGQVGQALHHETLPADWELGAFTRAECDITDHRTVQKTLHDFKPDCVINAAAMTAVDACETEQDKAMDANFEAPANLAAQCSAVDVPLIHISTDYVFDGKDGDIPYTTESLMSPLSVYGHSKMMGEQAVRDGHAYHIILRVSSVFSAFGTNLLTKTMQMIDKRDELKIVIDQTSCPTAAPEIAKALIVMASAVATGKRDGFGTFHLCGSPEINRLGFVQAIMDAYAPHTTRRPIITPALSADFPGFAERPAYSSLDCSRILKIYGIAQKPWRDGLDEAMRQLMLPHKQSA